MKERVEMVFNCFQEYVRFGQVAISLQEERRGIVREGAPSRQIALQRLGQEWPDMGGQPRHRRFLVCTSDHLENQSVFIGH